MAQPESRLRVHRPPARPTLIYDGQCRFCTGQVDHWKQLTGNTVDYLSSSTRAVQELFPEITPQRFHRSLQLIDTDGRVYEGAHGALRALDLAGRHRWLLRAYEGSRLCAALLEFGYRRVAAHRVWLGRSTDGN